MSNDFAVAWQNYFTALDELAKAVVVSREKMREMNERHLEPLWDLVIQEAKIELQEDVHIAEDAFYCAHLALKPFLEEDNE